MFLSKIKYCNSEFIYPFDEGSKQLDAFLDLLHEYVQEMNKIDKHVLLKTKDRLKEEYFWTRDTCYVLFKIKKKPIGFAILGCSSNCHPYADLYIEEFYIQKKYRRKGYGRHFMNLILVGNKKVCFYIIKKNDKALAFQKNIFSKWNDISDKVPAIMQRMHNVPDWLDWYCYNRSNYQPTA